MGQLGKTAEHGKDAGTLAKLNAGREESALETAACRRKEGYQSGATGRSGHRYDVPGGVSKLCGWEVLSDAYDVPVSTKKHVLRLLVKRKAGHHSLLVQYTARL